MPWTFNGISQTRLKKICRRNNNAKMSPGAEKNFGKNKIKIGNKQNFSSTNEIFTIFCRQIEKKKKTDNFCPEKGVGRAAYLRVADDRLRQREAVVKWINQL